MIVDCHVHCKGGDRYRREFSADEILAAMDEAGVDRSVVFAMCLPSVESQEMTQAVCSCAPERLIPFAHVLPDEGPLALVELDRAVTQLGFRGLKAHVGELPGDWSDEQMVDVLGPIVGLSGDLGVPCLLDAGCRYQVAEDLAARHPNTGVIVAHLGCSSDEQTVDRFIGLAATQHNVYLDTSYNHLPWKIGDAIRRCGVEKIIWGSDGPLIHPAIELKKLEVLSLPNDDWERVTSLNILDLLGET